MTATTGRQIWATVESSCEVVPGIFELVVRAPEIAATARPGQFVHLRVRESHDPLLRRPLSVGFVDGDQIGFLCRVIGHGTRILAQAVPGQTLDLIGPLGNPFTLHADRSAIFVAGGLGVADFPFLAECLRDAGCSQMDLIYGARASNELAWIDCVQAGGASVHVATDDGLGVHMLVNPDEVTMSAPPPSPFVVQLEPTYPSVRALLCPGDEVSPPGALGPLAVVSETEDPDHPLSADPLHGQLPRDLRTDGQEAARQVVFVRRFAGPAEQLVLLWVVDLKEATLLGRATFAHGVRSAGVDRGAGGGVALEDLC